MIQLIVPKKQPFDFVRALSPPKEPQSRQELTRLLEPISKALYSQTFVWAKDSAFVFPFPKTSLPQEILLSPTQNNQFHNHNQPSPLSDLQLGQIRQRGQFQVESGQADFPNRWKINDWLIKGTFNIKQTLFDEVALGLQLIFEMKQHFTKKSGYMLKDAWELVSEGGEGVANCLVGVKSVIRMDREQNKQFQRQVSLLRSKSIWENIDFALHRAIDRKDRSELQVGVLRNGLSMLNFDRIESAPREVQDSLKVYGAVLKQVDQKNYALDTVHARQLQLYRNQLSLQHYLLVRIYSWRTQRIDQYNQQLIKQQEADFQAFFKELAYSSKGGLPAVFRHYQNFREQPIEVVECESSRQNLHLKRLAFPPFRRLRKKEKIKNNWRWGYYFQRQIDYEVKSDHFFWLVQYYLINYYCIAVTGFISFFFLAINGTFGIRTLFNCSTFCTHQSINPQTGEVKPDLNSGVKGWCMRVRECANEIDEQRLSFENRPDRGFFGKSFSRVLNVLYCYIILGLVWTVLINCVLLPLVIIANFLICLLICVTSVVWAFFVNFFIYLFRVFVYDSNKTCCCSPLLAYTLMLFAGIFLALLNLLIVFLRPFAALLMLIYSLLHFLLKHVWEAIVFFFVRCCARSPSVDTGVAWRTAGPGISTGYFKCLQQEDVYLLYLYKMEQNQLKNFVEVYSSLIDQPLIKARKRIAVLTQAGVSFGDCFRKVQKSCSFYHQILQETYRDRVNKTARTDYKYEGIKFSSSQLQQYFHNTREIFMQRLQKGAPFLIDKDCSPQVMHRHLWLSVFGEDSLQPIEETERRVRINMNRSSLYSQVAKTLRNNNKFLDRKLNFQVKPKEQVIMEGSLPPFLCSRVLEAIDRGNSFSFNPQRASRREVQLSLFVSLRVEDQLDRRQQQQISRKEQVEFNLVEQIK